jgi:crotonobetainyl-CoA:carnitine CoA-transferase CaiB-like acyl-CoA transferase
VTKENTALGSLKVLDLANENGVYCGKLLSGMGADVIKVEKPGGDPTRNYGPFFQDSPHPEKSHYFAYLNTGKKSITLDLENRDGQEIFKKLVQISDVVLETFPVGYLESLGLDYPALKTLNPGIIMTSITPFGQTGPHKNWHASSEIIASAMGGVQFENGEPTEKPVQLGNFLIGYAAGIYAAVGTMAAYHNRFFTGEGNHVDISLQDICASWLDATYGNYQYPPYRVTQRWGSQSPTWVPSRLFRAKDGNIFLAGSNRWNLLAAWLVDEDIDIGDLVDPKYEGTNARDLLWAQKERINDLVNQLGMKHTKQEMMIEGQKREIPTTLVSTVKDIYNDPQLKERMYFVEEEHPVMGKLSYPGAPYKFMESPWQIGGPAPLIGQHNEEIYSELGFSKKDLIDLKQSGAI